MLAALRATCCFLKKCIDIVTCEKVLSSTISCFAKKWFILFPRFHSYCILKEFNLYHWNWLGVCISVCYQDNWSYDLDGPRVATNQSHAVYVWAGVTRNVTCTIHSEPPSSFEWRRSGQLITNNDTFQIFTSGCSSHLQVGRCCLHIGPAVHWTIFPTLVIGRSGRFWGPKIFRYLFFKMEFCMRWFDGLTADS